jgi:hypothetical protein
MVLVARMFLVQAAAGSDARMAAAICNKIGFSLLSFNFVLPHPHFHANERSSAMVAVVCRYTTALSIPEEKEREGSGFVTSCHNS